MPAQVHCTSARLRKRTRCHAHLYLLASTLAQPPWVSGGGGGGGSGDGGDGGGGGGVLVRVLLVRVLLACVRVCVCCVRCCVCVYGL